MGSFVFVFFLQGSTISKRTHSPLAICSQVNVQPSLAANCLRLEFCFTPILRHTNHDYCSLFVHKVYSFEKKKKKKKKTWRFAASLTLNVQPWPLTAWGWSLCFTSCTLWVARIIFFFGKYHIVIHPHYWFVFFLRGVYSFERNTLLIAWGWECCFTPILRRTYIMIIGPFFSFYRFEKRKKAWRFTARLRPNVQPWPLTAWGWSLFFTPILSSTLQYGLQE